jgi:hypothetical protein
MLLGCHPITSDIGMVQDVVEYWIGNGELEEMWCECEPSIYPLTDICITYCTDDIDPADPMEN